ncbi:uncharacterized protein [Rutidosis leptorrhynchoides]|uniref:uncharacterized protein n=1 Tax=Rutidosis leptorrhynchoides TaxID=125765 RepID=UPI003A9A0719
MENAYKMFNFIIDDSDDEKVVNFVKSLTEEEVEGEASSSRVPRTRVYIARDREDAAVREHPDAVGRQSLTILQKCTAAIRQMAYGTTPDMFDKYIKIGEKTVALCLDNFYRCVFHLFAPVYLRKPTADDIARLYNFHAQKHGLPVMLGIIDCMHWQWRNCPIAWQGQYTRGDQKGPSIMLEAVASQDLWI